MSNHLSSFKAILIFFPDLAVAGTKRVCAPGQMSAGHSQLHPSLSRGAYKRSCTKGQEQLRAALLTHQVTCQKQDCTADCSDPRCPGDGGSDCSVLSDSPCDRLSLPCLWAGGNERDTQSTRGSGLCPGCLICWGLSKCHHHQQCCLPPPSKSPASLPHATR